MRSEPTSAARCRSASPREDDGVVVELAQVLGGLLLERARAAVGEGGEDRVGPRAVGGQIAAAVGRADLEPGEAVQRALEDQVRERDGGLQGIADGVGEHAVALEPAGRLQLRRALRMDEDERAERLRLGPEGMEARVGQLRPVHAAADGGAAQAVLSACPPRAAAAARSGCCSATDAKATKRSGLAAHASASASFWRRISSRARSRLGLVPVGIDAERLHVDALLVHGAQPIRRAGT